MRIRDFKYVLNRQKGSPNLSQSFIESGIDKDSLRHLTRFDLFKQTSHVPGAVVEVGVGEGNGLGFWLKLRHYLNDSRQIYAFDSFEGFPQPSQYDFALLANPKGAYKKYTVNYVKSYLADLKISQADIDSVTFIKGWFPNSFSDYSKVPISLLNLDVDVYQSTKDSLEFFWPFITPGGVVILDEYDSEGDLEKWPGAKLAVDQFCRQNSLDVTRVFGNKAILRKVS